MSQDERHAGMAELADALDSGSSESNFMQVQVLFPAPNENFRENGSFYFTPKKYPVLFPAPNQYNPNRIFQIGNRFGFFLIFQSQRYNPLDLASMVSV